MNSVNKDELKGIAGWLGVYVWLSLITLPMFIAMMLSYSEYIKSVPPQFIEYFPKNIPFIERAILATVALTESFACIMLLTRRRVAVTIVKQVLLAKIGFVIAKLIIYLDYLHGIENLLMGVSIAPNTLFIPIGWYFYFKRSRRVINTFPDKLK